MKNNIIIAGCGYVGQALARELEQQGHNVWAIKRNAISLDDKLRYIYQDIGAITASELPKVIDYVFYMPAPNHSSNDSYQDTYLNHLKHFLQQLPMTVKRLFFISSTSVYGQTDGSWVDETSKTNPLNESSGIILQAEQYLATQAIPYTIARFGGIYGAGRTRLLEKSKKQTELLTKQDIYTNRIHQDDCVHSLIHLMNLSQVEKMYNIVDSDPIDKNALLLWLAEQLNVAPPTEFSSDNERVKRGNKRCCNKRLLATGYQLRYPSYKDGYRKLISS